MGKSDHKAFAAATPVSPDVSLFDFKGHQIRVVKIDGEPWFVAVDIYSILYGRTTGLTHISSILDATEKQVLMKADLGESNSLSSLFGGRGVYRLSLISESGLYKLVLRSDKPEAKPFQDWVTKEVLPAIRKDRAEYPDLFLGCRAYGFKA